MSGQSKAAGPSFFLWKSAAGCFCGGFCLNAEGMDAGAHEFPERCMHKPMSGQRGFAGKRLGDDMQAVVATAACSRMAGVLVRVIDQFDAYGLKGGETRVDQRLDFGEGQGAVLAHAGKTLRKGLTVTFS